MSNSTLAALRSVEAELTAQIAELEKKRQGIRSVMPMFEDTSDSENTESPEFSAGETLESLPAVDDSKSEEISEEALPEPVLAPSEELVSVETEPVPATKAAKPVKDKARKTAKTNRRKKDGRTADWQKYLREGTTEKPLPETVLFFLQTQPNQDFTVAEVMTALFHTADMPRALYLKARNRISNILSGGARDGEWSRVGTGVYSLSDSNSVAA